MNTIIALFNSWPEADFILYQASFLGLTENDMSILTPKTHATGAAVPATPGARYLGITAGAPLEMADLEFTAYGDWAALPMPPGKQANFDSLTAALKSHGVDNAVTAKLVHGLRKGSTLLFLASCTKGMVDKMKALLKDASILDIGPSAMIGQTGVLRQPSYYL